MGGGKSEVPSRCWDSPGEWGGTKGGGGVAQKPRGAEEPAAARPRARGAAPPPSPSLRGAMAPRAGAPPAAAAPVGVTLPGWAEEWSAEAARGAREALGELEAALRAGGPLPPPPGGVANGFYFAAHREALERAAKCLEGLGRAGAPSDSSSLESLREELDSAQLHVSRGRAEFQAVFSAYAARRADWNRLLGLAKGARAELGRAEDASLELLREVRRQSFRTAEEGCEARVRALREELADLHTHLEGVREGARRDVQHQERREAAERRAWLEERDGLQRAREAQAARALQLGQELQREREAALRATSAARERESGLEADVRRLGTHLRRAQQAGAELAVLSGTAGRRAAETLARARARERLRVSLLAWRLAAESTAAVRTAEARARSAREKERRGLEARVAQEQDRSLKLATGLARAEERLALMQAQSFQYRTKWMFGPENGEVVVSGEPEFLTQVAEA